MVWYPSVDDVIDMNIDALDLSGDKHPHKMLGSASGIQALLDNVKTKENDGLSYQAAPDESISYGSYLRWCKPQDSVWHSQDVPDEKR